MLPVFECKRNGEAWGESRLSHCPALLEHEYHVSASRRQQLRHRRIRRVSGELLCRQLVFGDRGVFAISGHLAAPGTGHSVLPRVDVRAIFGWV